MKEKLHLMICLLRLLPVLPGVRWQDQRFMQDVVRWQKQLGISGTLRKTLALLLADQRAFRNLFIYRNRSRMFFSRWIRLWYRPMDTLFIEARDIGGGLYIQHGFSTMIAAESIGENCWINQQVTIGYKDRSGAPVIGDNVTITCGAKVLGNITVGNGAVIGANAVVVKDVAPNAVMGGIPARVLKWRSEDDNQ